MADDSFAGSAWTAGSAVVGGLSTAIWADLSYRYLYSKSVYKGLQAGAGWQHPGVFNWTSHFRGGEWIGARIVGADASKASAFRRGVGKFFAGGSVGNFGFNPDVISDKYTRFHGTPLGGGKNSTVGKGVSAAYRRATNIRGFGTAGVYLSTAMLVAAIAPLAFHAAKGVVNIAKVARMPLNQLNLTDWGGQLASGYMTGQAYTERQRAEQHARQTGQAGQIYGREAAMMHS